ncbi:MAG TPA: TonB C-terminal domain-containing protein [Longimicrobiaceae bacterium]|nr:TonB C-terminal domain-containing protein [Longimicrobiaceae bacterium]
MKRRSSGRRWWAYVTSAVVHVGVIGLLWGAAGMGEERPPMRVYAVDIVSPPPQAAGEFDPNPGGAAPAAPEPEPEPVKPSPPPKPEPAPPEVEHSTPAPATKAPEPKPVPKQPAPKEKPKPAPEKTQASAKGTGGEEKTEKSTGKPTPSRGAKPDASSPGGQGLDVHLKGVQCPSPDYCANIVTQLYRYFRPPPEATTDAAEVFFWINQDGSVSDIEVTRSSGSFRFAAAAMEAVEQAGLHKAFGPLPREFERDRLPVSFFFRPAR